MAFDRDKLEALRARFGDSQGGETFDPRFRRVAEKIFSESGTRLAPYSGMPTFLTAPYRAGRRRTSPISAICRWR